MVQSFGRRLVLCVLLVSLVVVLQPAPASAAATFRFASSQGFCELTGKTAEEQTMLRLLNAAADPKTVQLVSAYVDCNVFPDIRSGKKKVAFPLVTLQVAKTDGKILPLSTVDFNNLKDVVQSALSTTDMTETDKSAVAELQRMLQERRSTVEFDYRATPPTIVDSSDRTVSVARNQEFNLGSVSVKATVIATTTLVDGYLVMATMADEVRTPKDFWRMQLMTEMLARGIEKTGTGAVGEADQGSNVQPSAGQSTWTYLEPNANEKGIGVPSSNGGSQAFFIECFNNRTYTRVLIQNQPLVGANGAPVQVRYSLDGKLDSAHWNVFRNGQGLEIGTFVGALPFVKKLFGHSELSLTVKATGLPAATYLFNISGVADAVSPVRQTCGW